MASDHSSKKKNAPGHSAEGPSDSDNASKKKVASATSTDVVTLKGMRFHARIGVLPHEAEIAQSIEVDASLWFRRGRGRPTAKDIVDYRRVYELVADVVTKGHTNFLEEVGERIADRALQLPLVERVRIAVRKPNVALPGPLEYAEVALERERA
jgi:dihydroneopterin aldolase